MKLVAVAAAALNQTPLAFRANGANVIGAFEDARAADVDVLCLPELCLTGYGCEDAFASPFVRDAALESLHRVAPESRGLVTLVGLPFELGGAVFNTVALLADGKIAGIVPKQNLAGDGIHYEPRWFKAWPQGARTRVRLGDEDIPFGDLRFDFDGIRIGLEICEDAWVAGRPGGTLAADAVDIILNPSASHFAFDKRDIRRRLVQEGSRAFSVSYVYANLLGNEAGRAIYDGHVLVAEGGRLVAEGRRMSFGARQMVRAVVDVSGTRAARAASASFEPRIPPEDFVALASPRLRDRDVERPRSSLAEFETSPFLKEEEFARAVALGLFDHARKSGSRGFVVSLSGGADSAICAYLVSLAVQLAREELGLEGASARWPGLPAAGTNREAVHAVLTTAYQSTRNSGDVTRTAAREVARALGAHHHELDVDALVESYVALAEGALGRELTFETDDLALQNVQARVRAPSVWMLANVEQKLLLATSNRSEAAVGYATMDGDTAGGLSPIAGADKAFLRRFLRFVESVGPEGCGAVPAMSYVNAQAPTAELRPASALQSDEKDLMPYDVLDRIERLLVRDKKSPADVDRVLAVEMPELRDEERRRHIVRFVRLFARNQWKRERYAPSFHVDDESLDPKTFFRFPILSGGFEEALEELLRSTPSR